MIKCPYCLSVVEAEALVCKTCTKDLYLFKPMMERVAALEERLAEIPDREALEKRIEELEAHIEAMREEQEGQEETSAHWLGQILQFLLIPLAVLLIGHALITVVYDLPLVYLRLLSIVTPLPFAFVLFLRRRRPIVRWFMGSAALASCAVIGMSGITAVVDGTPILPQSAIEWKEFIEYSASISFSFLTGMLLGSIGYARRHRAGNIRVSPWLSAIVTGFIGEGKLSPESVQKLIRKLNEFGGMIVAIGTTAVSLYTGLKGVL